MIKHVEDSDHMHPDDDLVLFKLNDMLHPVAGRIRHFDGSGKYKTASYVYIHRGDGLILQKYTYGFEILKYI